MGEEGEKSVGILVHVGNGNGDEKMYPSPLLPHDEVVRSPMVFMETLRRFHSAMGTRFMIPVIGGKELDLYQLYFEVTQRGGLEKVIGGRRWREVIRVFNFPPTTTSASFVLRKYYISLLHHFEQVYFFRLQGPLVPPATILQTKSPYSNPQHHQVEVRNRKRDFAETQSEASSRIELTGTVNGKFEHGYLVTVKMRSEILHGVLYHPFSREASSSSISTTPYYFSEQKKRKRKKGWRSKDPRHPKPNRSAYNFFFAQEHSKLKNMYPNQEREFSKMIGESWSKLRTEDRMVYHDIGMKDKERYRREMQEYNEKLKLVQPSLQLPKIKK